MSKNTKATDVADATTVTAEVVSNDTLAIVDNTAATEVAATPVQTEEYELIGGLTQVNYL